MEKATRTTQVYLIALSVSFVFLYLRTFHLLRVPFAANGDEVLFFSRAIRLVHGQTLYRDVFELVTPGTELLYALGFRIFGVHGWVFQAWHIGLGAGLCLVITSIARRIVTGWAVFLPMVLFLVFDLSSAMDATHHWWSTFSALLAVSILMRGWDRWRIALCGCLCAIATLFTQTQGVAVFLAVSIYLTFEAWGDTRILRTKLSALVFSYTALCAVVLGYYAYVVGSRRLFYDLVVFPLTGLTGPMNSPSAYLHQWPQIHGTADLIRLIPLVIILSLVPYVYLFSLYELWKRRRATAPERRGQILLLNLVGLALFVSISTGPRFFRICTVAPPALLVFTWHLEQVGQQYRTARAGLWSIAAAFFVWLPLHRQVQWHHTLSLPTGTIAFSDPGQWQEVQWLQRRTSPGDTMFNNAAAILYLGLRNPMHLEFINNDGFTSAQDVQKILARMKNDEPKYIAVYPDIPLTPYDHAEPFRAYVREHYSLKERLLIGPNQYVEELWERCSHCLSVR